MRYLICARYRPQSFRYYSAIAAASNSVGRPLTALPGIEITTAEGVHLIAIFPATYSAERQTRFYGWLQIDGKGKTNEASKCPVDDIFKKVLDEGGVIVIPHPFTPDIGLLDSHRKMNIKMGWLDSGCVRLMQVAEREEVGIPSIATTRTTG